jgi:hypothetical protein
VKKLECLMPSSPFVHRAAPDPQSSFGSVAAHAWDDPFSIFPDRKFRLASHRCLQIRICYELFVSILGVDGPNEFGSSFMYSCQFERGCVLVRIFNENTLRHYVTVVVAR